MKYLEYCLKTGIAAVLSLTMLAGCGAKNVEEGEPSTQVPVTETAAPTATPTKEPAPEVTEEPTEQPTEEPAEESTKEPEITEEANEWLDSKLEELKEKKPEYKTYECETFPAGDWCYVILAEPGQDKEEFMSYNVDIWAVNKDQMVQMEEYNCILPEGYGLVEIGGDTYFRYDISYATDSMTQLCYGMEDDCKKIQFGGALTSIDGTDITFTRSSYDLCYSKADEVGMGHTWKTYYGRIEDHEYYEYEISELSEKEFLAYEGAAAIKKRLKKEYDTHDYQLNLEYKQRENGLIHVNIHQESDTEIVNYFETFRINGTKLEKVDQGEGYYE